MIRIKSAYIVPSYLPVYRLYISNYFRNNETNTQSSTIEEDDFG